MANQYRITTNGKRFRIEIKDTPEKPWRLYGTGTYPSEQAARDMIDFLDTESGEWVPIAEAVQS